MASDFCVHNKEIIAVKNENDIINRWLMTTVNISSLASLKGRTVESNKYVVNG